MKRVNILSLLMVMLLIVLAACGEQVAPCEDPTVPIEVEFSWTPEHPQEDEAVVLKAHVTHNGQDVINEEELMQNIQFEIWEHSNPDYHHMVEAKHEGNGVYTLDWTFDKEGVYYAYYHVTACDMHRMEKEMIVVGSPNVEEITAEEDTVSTKMSGAHGDSSDHEGHENKEESNH